jgi:hypothetical protein
MTSYQDSTGRNADTGDSSSGDLLLANGWVDNVGLSDRVLVVGELARVQPSVAIITANTRMIDEPLAVLGILTSSPESESRKLCRRPSESRQASGDGTTARHCHRQNPEGGGLRIARLLVPTYV